MVKLIVSPRLRKKKKKMNGYLVLNTHIYFIKPERYFIVSHCFKKKKTLDYSKIFLLCISLESGDR